MSEQAIVDRIISDARAEAEKIVALAEEKAKKTVGEARLKAERSEAGNRAEVKKRTESILEGKSASARLECAKIMLAEKRRVIDEIYKKALDGLNALTKSEALYLATRLLEQFAEEGDEIVFAKNYRYMKEVSDLSYVKEKGLKVSAKYADIEGGFILVGKSSDKNLSYTALLADDREANQADIALEVFKDGR